MPDQTRRETMAMDGYILSKRGYVPEKVQGGYKPKASAQPSPPSGGSAIKQPRNASQ
jgi:hypothetical protein